MHFSMADLLACDPALRQDARFGYLLAMYRLGERAEFEVRWRGALQEAGEPGDARRVRLLGAFAYGLGTEASAGDALRLELWRGRLDGERTSRLDEQWPGGVPAEVRRAQKELGTSPTRPPWLAGILSAVLPGLGQVISGSWQSAFVALAVNALFIGATVELFRHQLWFAGAAAGTVASVTYLGNIVNAVESATLFNESRRREAEEHLERALFPELFPGSRLQVSW
jgi:hypothetical protein